MLVDHNAHERTSHLVHVHAHNMHATVGCACACIVCMHMHIVKNQTLRRVVHEYIKLL